MLNRFTIFHKHAITEEILEYVRETDNGNLLLIDLSKHKRPSAYSYEAITGSDDFNEAIALFEQVKKIGVSSFLEQFV